MQINTQEWKNLLKHEAEEIGFDMNINQIDQLGVFASELIEFNTRFNITAIKDPHELITKHIIDSLILTRYIPDQASIIDIGTGGGFPGIPLKIYNPSLLLTLIDSSRKKINFIKYITRRLHLTSVEIMQTRAEQFLLDEPSRKFDIAVSRAVMALDRFIPLAFPLVKENGSIISMKGDKKNIQDELMCLKTHTDSSQESISKFQYSIQIKAYRLPNVNNDRHIVIVQK